MKSRSKKYNRLALFLLLAGIALTALTFRTGYYAVHPEQYPDPAPKWPAMVGSFCLVFSLVYYFLGLRERKKEVQNKN